MLQSGSRFGVIWPGTIQNLIKHQKNLLIARHLAAQAQPKIETEAHDPEWNNARPYSEVPGPKGISLVVQFLPGGKYYNKSMLELNRGLRKDFGDIICLKGFFRRNDIIFVFDPLDFEKVFRTEGIWPTRNGMETFTYFRQHVRPDIFKGNGGLVAEQGENWADMRTKVNPVMMQPKTAKLYVKPVDDIAMELVQKIRAERDSNNEMAKNFDSTMQKWSLESIAVIALDTRLNLLSNSESSARGERIATLVRDFFEYAYQLEILPSLWKYYKTSTFKKQMACLNELTENILYYVDRAMKHAEDHPSDHKSDHELSVLEKLLKIDRTAAFVMASDMLLAGVDTTSSLAMSLMYALAKNPEKQEKLRQELIQILPEKDTPFTAEKLRNLPYLRACIKETNRFLPVTNGNFRATGRDIVLKGYKIPKGTDVAMGAINLYYDDSVYPRSSEFIPERWLKNVEHTECPSAKTANPFVFLPFGFGARMCIGRRFAELETELVISRLVRNFNIEWHYDDLQYIGKFINVPTGDLKIRFNDIQ